MLDAKRKTICIVGCGRWLGGDDQVGLRVVESLVATSLARVARLQVTESPATDIPLWLDDCELLILVDAAAASSLRQPAEFERVDYRATPERIKRSETGETHGLGCATALLLAERLGQLPREVWIYAVAIAGAARGEHLSPNVAHAVPLVCAAIRRDIVRWKAMHNTDEKPEPSHA